MLLGGVSGGIGPCVNNPLDVVKTRLQKQVPQSIICILLFVFLFLLLFHQGSERASNLKIRLQKQVPQLFVVILVFYSSSLYLAKRASKRSAVISYDGGVVITFSAENNF